MKLILHDIKDDPENLISQADENTIVFSAHPMVKTCNACMGCFLKTPGMCVIDDRGRDFLRYFSQADEIHIVSEMLYGGLSVEIKAIQDRCLGYLLPFFEIKEDRMHHPPRYENSISLHYHIYSSEGAEMTVFETECMKGIARANSRNLSVKSFTCDFYQSSDEVAL